LDDELREATGGGVGFKFYPNMSMGDEKDVIRKIRLGQVNAAGFTGRGLGEILPEVRILELPYVFDNVREIDYVTGELTGYFEKAFAEQGFILLGWAEVGWIYFLAKKPVAEPEDLRGTKAWMWQGDPLAEAFFKELGKSPISFPVTDVNLSLQRGAIDAVYCSPLAALVLQWFTRLKYISDIPFTDAIGAVLLDKRTFDRLCPEHQTILKELSRKKLRDLVLQSRSDNREAYRQLIAEGLEPVPSSSDQRRLMKEIGVRVQERLADDLYPRELLDRVRALIADCRHEAGSTDNER